jgi:hypothetical protein
MLLHLRWVKETMMGQNSAFLTGYKSRINNYRNYFLWWASQVPSVIKG